MKQTKDKARKSAPSDSILAIYLNDLNKLAPLPEDERDAVAKKAAEGDAAARDRLIKTHLRFVVNIAKKYQGKGLPLSDLINEGNMGLVFAAGRFDPSRGYKFITYAVWWIRQSILKAIYDKSRAIRLPTNRISELTRIEHAGKASGGNMAESEAKRISTELNMDVRDVRLLMQISRNLVSIDAPAYTETPDSPAIVDGISDERTILPEECAINALMSADIEHSLSELPGREASIIRYHYGIGSNTQMSLRELGIAMGITKERARQIEKKALKQLASHRSAQRLKPYCA